VWEVGLQSAREDGDEMEELFFCSAPCYMQFSLMHKSPNEIVERAGTVVDHTGKSPSVDQAAQPPPDVKPFKGNKYKLWQPGCLQPNSK